MCVCARERACMSLCVLVYFLIYKYIYTNKYIYVHTHTHIRTHTHAHTHTYRPIAICYVVHHTEEADNNDYTVLAFMTSCTTVATGRDKTSFIYKDPIY